MITTLVTIAEAEKKVCPFLDGPCRPRDCMQWAWTTKIHRDTGDRMGVCSVSGFKGKWHPRAKESKKELPATRPRSDSAESSYARASAREIVDFKKKSAPAIAEVDDSEII